MEESASVGQALKPLPLKRFRYKQHMPWQMPLILNVRALARSVR